MAVSHWDSEVNCLMLTLPSQNWSAPPSGRDRRSWVDSVATVASGPTSLCVLRRRRPRCTSSKKENSRLDCSCSSTSQELVSDSLGNISLCGCRTSPHSRISSSARSLCICEHQYSSSWISRLVNVGHPRVFNVNRLSAKSWKSYQSRNVYSETCHLLSLLSTNTSTVTSQSRHRTVEINQSITFIRQSMKHLNNQGNDRLPEQARAQQS